MPADTRWRLPAPAWNPEPSGELLCGYLVADQEDRDALALRLLHERSEGAQGLADLIDTLTMYPDQRRRVVRLRGELEAS